MTSLWRAMCAVLLIGAAVLMAWGNVPPARGDEPALPPQPPPPAAEADEQPAAQDAVGAAQPMVLYTGTTVLVGGGPPPNTMLAAVGIDPFADVVLPLIPWSVLKTLGLNTVDGIPANQEALIAYAQQNAQSFRPILISELNFVRLECSDDLTKEQRLTIKKAAEKSLQHAAECMTKFQLGLYVGQSEAPNPQKLMTADLLVTLADVLPPKKLAHYVEEFAKRRDKQRRAGVLAAVARIDGLLRLSPEQRDKIVDSLIAERTQNVEEWVAVVNYPDNYVPEIPDRLMQPHLNKEQMQAWKELEKVSLGVMWNNMNQFHVPETEWWGGLIEPAAQQQFGIPAAAMLQVSE